MHQAIPSRLPLLAILLASGALIGCGENDSSREAVRKAGHQFTSVASGDAGAFPEVTTQAYSNIVSGLTPYAGDENGYTEAAAVSLAQAHLGQAAQAGRAAARAEADALRMTRGIQGALSEFLTLGAIAQAAGEFDPATDLSEIDRLIEQRRADAAEYRQRKAEIDEQIASMETRIADLRGRANAEREQAGRLGLRIPSVNAQEAAEIAAEVREFTLRADQFDFEATRIQGRVGQLRPTSAEIDLNVGKAQAQIDLLEDSQRELRARLQAAQQDAAEARAAAAQARERLGRLVQELAAFRESDVASKAARVESLVGQAQAALRDAGPVLASSVSMTRASIQELIGSAKARSAAGHRHAAEIYEALADAGVPGPLAENAREARAAAAEAETAAKQAYRAAADALRGLRAKGDAADRVADAAERLDRLAGVEPESEAEFDPEFDPEAEPMDEGFEDQPAADDE